MEATLVALGAYLLGSVPTGLLVARARGIDIRKVGSGNIGATNVGRALGRRFAALVLLVDAAKGFVPVLVARRLDLPPPAIALAGFLAVVGHMFTVFLRGRGGKGVATSFGAALALAPAAAGASVAVYAVLLAATRISSVGSLAAVTSFPVFLWLWGERTWPNLAFGGAITALVWFRHRENLRRLGRGEELKAP